MDSENILKPLADALRPSLTSELVGHDKLLSGDAFLAKQLTNGLSMSLILWGPPGSGKTTIARLLCKATPKSRYVELSAVQAGKDDIRKTVEDAKAYQRLGERTVLFLDEIHRFNKAQQDSLLPHVESGLLLLIGATTENPSFTVITPLMSRTHLVVLSELDDGAMENILQRAAKKLNLKIAKGAGEKLIAAAGGDARSLLTLVEVVDSAKTTRNISAEFIDKLFSGQVTLRHDRKGESHYNLASALIKSLRGSSEEGSLYYMGRLLEGGEDPNFIARRLVIFASEDIGLAWPGALTLALNCAQSVEKIGLPECKYALVQTALMLARAPKSREVSEALKAMTKAVEDHPFAPVPLHLRNAVSGMMKDLGYAKDYKWKANFQPKQGFLPDGVAIELKKKSP
jgi:putative ATPase